MDDIIIRKAGIDDAESIAKIKIEGWQTAYRGILDDSYLDSLDVKIEIIRRKLDIENGTNIFVAELDGKIVGFCLFREYVKDNDKYPGFDCELSSLYVANDYKRRGIGKKLMLSTISYLKEKGKTKMILGCLKDNFPSRVFYEKMGGKVLSYEKLTFGNNDYDLVMYQYNLFLEDK